MWAQQHLSPAQIWSTGRKLKFLSTKTVNNQNKKQLCSKKTPHSEVNGQKSLCSRHRQTEYSVPRGRLRSREAKVHFSKSQNHRMLSVGRDFKRSSSPKIHCHSQGYLTLKTLPNLALNPARVGASTASLDNLFQYLTTPTVKNFFLISNLNLSFFNLLLVNTSEVIPTFSPCALCSDMKLINMKNKLLGSVDK